MLNFFISKTSGKVIPIIPICQSNFKDWMPRQSARIRNQVTSSRFLAKPNTFCLLTKSNGNLEKVLLGLANKEDFFAFGVLPKVLPTGCYHIDTFDFTSEQLEYAAIGWGMGSYQFKRYKTVEKMAAKLLCNRDDYNITMINSVIKSIFLVRDLINTPANDLYPEKLAKIAADLAQEFNAELKVVKGDKLATDFPLVYAVGRGSKREPLLIDLHYGDSRDPKIVLVGKGVCFDSGGLQLKSSSGMLLMKKDMAGAAHALGLARMIMEAKLPVNLRVIIPAVENLISGDSLKPGDIVKTRKGITVEVDNTDAEGRLILADALAFASEWRPKLILDFATLTSAAKIALGPNITALFTNNDKLAEDISVNMRDEQESIWRMPLYQPYLEFLKSEIADFKNVASSDNVGAGAIIAALFLQQFVERGIEWAHFDMHAYNTTSKPGKPKEGEALCLKGLFKFFCLTSQCYIG